MLKSYVIHDDESEIACYWKSFIPLHPQQQGHRSTTSVSWEEFINDSWEGGESHTPNTCSLRATWCWYGTTSDASCCDGVVNVVLGSGLGGRNAHGIGFKNSLSENEYHKMDASSHLLNHAFCARKYCAHHGKTLPEVVPFGPHSPHAMQ